MHDIKLNVSLLPKQKEFWYSRVNSIYVAGYGSGKSYAGTIKTITKKLQYRDYKVAYYLPHYGLVRDIAFDKFPTILDELGLKYTLNKSDKELHIDNYGTIVFRSMDNPQTIVGYEVAYSLIDEADILPMEKMEKVYNKILARNRSVENAQVDAVSTPEGYKWLYKQAKSGHFNVIQAKTTENKFLPRDYIENLKNQYPPNLLEAYLNGEFVNLTSGTVYSYFDRKKHHAKIDYNEHEQLHIGQDFNINGCISTVHVIRGDTAYRIKDFESIDSFSIIPNIRKVFKENPLIFYPDASGWSGKTNASRSDIQILKDGGANVQAPRANGRVQDRVNTGNTMFFQNRYFIDCDECPKGVQALEQQAYSDKGEPEKFNDPASVDDYNDSWTYFVERKFGVSKVRYNKFTNNFN